MAFHAPRDPSCSPSSNIMTMNSTYTSSPPATPRPTQAGAANSTTIVVMMKAEDPYIEPKLDVLDWVLVIIAGVVVVLRIYNKYRRRIELWWDDYIAMVSWTLLLALTVTLTFEIHYGTGRHIAELDSATLRKFNLTVEVGSTIAIVVTALAKTGFAVSLLKIAQGWPRSIIWLIIALVNIVSGIAGTLLWLGCTPLRKNFEETKFGFCWPSSTRVDIQIMNTSVSGTTDIALSVLGLYLVHKNTMKQGYWVGALVCAILGIFAGITGYAKSTIMHILAGGDLTFDVVTLIVWGVIEPAVIIIAASLPELRDYIWKHPKPIRYHYDDFLSRKNGLSFGTDYEYVRRQYVAAGRRTMTHDTESARSRPGPWI